MSWIIKQDGQTKILTILSQYAVIILIIYSIYGK